MYKHDSHFGRRVEERFLESLDAYGQTARPTGGFLHAVLCNDLREACARADEGAQGQLFDIVGYVYNELPSGCWGSPAKVLAWMTMEEEEEA